MKETSTHPHPPVQGEVGSRFEYKSGNCVLWTRDGACVDDIALIRDDDRLFATDNTPFPQLLRELRTPGLRNVPLTAANGMPPSQQFQTWGWPRIGQLVGAETVRSKLLTGWLHTSAEASVLLLINMVAFLSPPTEVASEPPMPVLRMHFWFAGLGMVAALFALVLAVLLSMQLNLLPHEADVFWFLRAYGSWLFGWPTVCVCARAPVFMRCFHMCLAVVGCLGVFGCQRTTLRESFTMGALADADPSRPVAGQHERAVCFERRTHVSYHGHVNRHFGVSFTHLRLLRSGGIPVSTDSQELLGADQRNVNYKSVAW